MLYDRGEHKLGVEPAWDMREKKGENYSIEP